MRATMLVQDLQAEHAELFGVVSRVDEKSWTRQTRSVGWSVADQISHLQFYDERATLALVDPDGFIKDRQRLWANRSHDESVDRGRLLSSAELLDRWSNSQVALLAASRLADPAVRVPWYGPSMSLQSFLTARLMECWAHGTDICQVLEIDPLVSHRLRHVAHIGVGARPYSLEINALPDDSRGVYVDLLAPDGSRWSWGDADCQSRVSGRALEFCLVVTQRLRYEQSGLLIEGQAAQVWMEVAQAFAGPSGRRDKHVH